MTKREFVRGSGAVAIGATLLGVFTAAAQLPTGSGPADVSRDSLGCAHGVALALMERPATAESVLTVALADAPENPCALNNLGNLQLIAGDTELALVLYTRAATLDTSDAGIVLNQATALWLLGKDDEATQLATRGIALAGGEQQALALLGLHRSAAPADSARGTELGARTGGAWNRLRPRHPDGSLKKEIRALLSNGNARVARGYAANDSSAARGALIVTASSAGVPISALSLYWRY